MKFIAVDVETANCDISSICQIGMAKYEDSVLTAQWKSYVDPEDEFDEINTEIHGIDETTVAGAPTFPELVDKIASFAGDNVLVCHTHFDRVALEQSYLWAALEKPRFIWLDTARVARRTWESCRDSGYGLEDVCTMLGYEFKHHDALEDAKAAAHILLAASKAKGLDIAGWMKRVGQAITSDGLGIKREGNSEGPLYGEVIVFTGSMVMPRIEAAQIAAAAGCNVTDTVTKKTTILVVGDQDIRRINKFPARERAGGGLSICLTIRPEYDISTGKMTVSLVQDDQPEQVPDPPIVHTKSSKHRKAEKLIAGGQAIRILRESDFMKLVDVPRE